MKLLGGNRHHLLLLLVSVVFPLEGNLTIFQRQSSSVPLMGSSQFGRA
jgi:hypothetical protein